MSKITSLYWEIIPHIFRYSCNHYFKLYESHSNSSTEYKNYCCLKSVLILCGKENVNICVQHTITFIVTIVVLHRKEKYYVDRSICTHTCTHTHTHTHTHIYIHTQTHTNTHTHIHTHKHTQTHTHLPCPVVSLSSMGHRVFFKKGRDRNSKSRPPHNHAKYTWFTGSSHGAATWNPENQCECSSSIHPSIVLVHRLELSLS